MLFRENNNLGVLFEFFLSWWWVISFVLICFVSYMQVSEKKMASFDKLTLRLDDLKTKREHMLREKADLMQQINSQSDPLWIERVLMKGLGLVPEGQKKILFKDD